MKDNGVNDSIETWSVSHICVAICMCTDTFTLILVRGHMHDSVTYYSIPIELLKFNFSHKNF